MCPGWCGVFYRPPQPVKRHRGFFRMKSVWLHSGQVAEKLGENHHLSRRSVAGGAIAQPQKRVTKTFPREIRFALRNSLLATRHYGDRAASDALPSSLNPPAGPVRLLQLLHLLLGHPAQHLDGTQARATHIGANDLHRIHHREAGTGARYGNEYRGKSRSSPRVHRRWPLRPQTGHHAASHCAP